MCTAYWVLTPKADNKRRKRKIYRPRLNIQTQINFGTMLVKVNWKSQISSAKKLGMSDLGIRKGSCWNTSQNPHLFGIFYSIIFRSSLVGVEASIPCLFRTLVLDSKTTGWVIFTEPNSSQMQAWARFMNNNIKNHPPNWRNIRSKSNLQHMDCS